MKKKKQTTDATPLPTNQTGGQYLRGDRNETNRSRKKKGGKEKKKMKTVKSSTKSLSLQPCPPRHWSSERGTRNCADEVTRMPERTPFPTGSIGASSFGRMNDSPCTCLAVLRSGY